MGDQIVRLTADGKAKAQWNGVVRLVPEHFRAPPNNTCAPNIAGVHSEGQQRVTLRRTPGETAMTTTTQTTSTTSWLILANGMEMGSYPGATREDAIAAYIADAGYASIDAAAEVLDMSRAALISQLDVTEEGGQGRDL